MKILELGSYISVAYAGMVLAEQGHTVTKWVSPERDDPILGLRDGERLWEWINHGKDVRRRHAALVRNIPRGRPGEFDVVIDNIRAATWESWDTSPAEQARRLGVGWVSLRDEFDGRSFDAVAQARAWGDHAPYVPFYIGDTAAGLWLAFKAMNVCLGEHCILRQASTLAKLVEGELNVQTKRDGVTTPWDEPGTYGVGPDGDARVQFRGETITEPPRDAAWRWQNLDHDGTGRIEI